MANDKIDSDPRIRYSVTKLFLTGCRFVDDYSPRAAVEYYLRMHPDADEKAVMDELMRELDALKFFDDEIPSQQKP